MKTSWFAVVLLTSTVMRTQAQQDASDWVPADQPAPPTPTSYRIVERGANHRVWQRETYDQSPSDRVVPHVHKYTELATGMYYQKDGQWFESKEEIDLLPQGGAAATQGQYQVYFPADIYQGVVELVTPDGAHLQSRPLGISYDDGTKTVLIAELKDSVGQLVSSNQVIFPDAFTDFKADLVCTYRKSGFECDLVFREQPPGPEAFGLNPQASRLELQTEFFNAPEPMETAGAVSRSDGLHDTTLKFGTMIMGRGKAFTVGDSAPSGGRHSSTQIPVYKNWLHLDGRTFLVEEVPYPRIGAQLQTLPLPVGATNQASSGNSVLHKVSAMRLLPPSRLVQVSTNTVQLAKADIIQKPGVVLDWLTFSGGSNYTFHGDATYYVSGECDLSGTVTYEGGTVVKFDSNGLINIVENCTIDCQTSGYRPAVFTSVNDNSVGEWLCYYDENWNQICIGGSGSPSFGDVYTFLNICCSNAVLRNMRFSYAVRSITMRINFGNLDVWDCQFMDIGMAINVLDPDVGLHNVLINEVDDDNPIYIDGAGNLVAENVTCEGYSLVAWGDGQVFETNCLITGGSYVQWIVTPDNQGWTNSPHYQTVGGGSFYLTNSSPYRNMGTTNISPALLAELRQKTTYPPVFLTNVITQDTFLTNVAQRDTDTPDLGYHYDPIDYLTHCTVSNATLTLSNGVVLGYIYLPNLAKGVRLQNGGNLISQGTPDRRNYFVSPVLVQERLFEPASWNWRMVAPIDLSSNSTAYLRFTSLIVPAAENYAFYAGAGSFMLQDCEVYSLRAEFDSDGSASGALENNLFVDPAVNCEQVNAFNNLFVGGYANLGSGSSTNRDNAFDGCTSDLNGTNDHNAYLNGAEIQSAVQPSDIITNLTWVAGRLGHYYQPADSPLIDAGSRTADEAGLGDYTTQADQTKDSGNVDIGFHYKVFDPPSASDFSKQTCRNTAVDFALDGWSPHNYPLNYTVLTNPTNGVLSGIVPSLTYTPATNFEGFDNFTYKVNDGFFDSDIATVSITVGYQPAANGQLVLTGTNQSVDLTLTGSDQCNDPLTCVVDDGPDMGTLTGSGSNYVYTPDTDYEGSDSFTFHVNNSLFNSGSATISILVISGPQLTATGRADGIALAGIVPDNLYSYITDYRIQRATNSGGPYTVVTVLESESLNYRTHPQFLDTTVTNNETNYYVMTFHYVDSRDITNESPFSNEAAASKNALPAVIRPGFDGSFLGPNDDGSTVLIDLPFTINFYGTSYSNLYVNNNGNVTFGGALRDYSPVPLAFEGTNIIAPFWADVDTRAALSDVVRFGTNTAYGKAAFGVDWLYVGYYATRDDKLNVFQLVLIDRSDRATGDYDVEFNYAQIQWEAGDYFSGGSEGLWVGPNGSPARAGYASASGSEFEFNVSGIPRAFLDANTETGLIYTNFNSTVPGRYVFQFHDGTPLGHP